MFAFKRLLLILLMTVMSRSFAFDLRDWYSFTNNSHRTMTVIYKSCIYTLSSSPSECNEPSTVVLQPGESKSFKIDSSDNLWKNDRDHFVRVISIMNAATDVSSASFIVTNDEANQWKAIHGNENGAGNIQWCGVSYEGSRSLNDYGTDTIFCTAEFLTPK